MPVPSASEYIFREGWTEQIRMRLSHDDLIMNLSGKTVTLVGKDGTGATVTIGSPKVGISSATTGIVFFDPDPTDLVAAKSPYKLRWQITHEDGRISFFPNKSYMPWFVDMP